ncbi:DUF4145 domain-containing protein [Vogesella sp. DC21W]|uniref:DUF4145 domain-containing protein n=1 Tax=Vogesella aquatica TaxID=2984206 RepID=A0ABT5J1C4_9NEIS|nr:DUF4145 domain-containing protein [Vogesella aquatica]MDC7718647.1 DUF4145 domain-containing protein [Vogesella aquatica]
MSRVIIAGDTMRIEIDRCPRCNIASPFIVGLRKHAQDRQWGPSSNMLSCTACDQSVLVEYSGSKLINMFPSIETTDEAIPEKARDFLNQAIATMNIASSGSLMLSASCIDEMLKVKGYKTGRLNDRIKKAAEDHVITKEMEMWAHEIRLEANDQRHADEDAEPATPENAQRIVTFAKALAEFLFVLPSKIEKARSK